MLWHTLTAKGQGKRDIMYIKAFDNHLAVISMNSEIHTGFWWENMKVSDYLEDLVIDRG